MPASVFDSEPAPLIDPLSVTLPALEMNALPSNSMLLATVLPSPWISSVDEESGSPASPIRIRLTSTPGLLVARVPCSMRVSPERALVPSSSSRPAPRLTRLPAPCKEAATVPLPPSTSSTTDSLAARVVPVTVKPLLAFSVVEPPTAEIMLPVTVRPPLALSVVEPPFAEIRAPVTVMPTSEFSVTEPPLAETVTPDAMRPPLAWTLVDPLRLLSETLPDRLTATPEAELPAETGSPRAACWAAP